MKFCPNGPSLLQISMISIILAANVRMRILVQYFKRAQDSMFVFQRHGIVAGNASSISLHVFIHFKHMMRLDQKLGRGSNYSAVNV